jgi:hypothetical protein
MVAEIDKQEITVVALAVDPARQADLLANVVKGQRPAGVGSKYVHGLAELAMSPGSRRSGRIIEARPVRGKGDLVNSKRHVVQLGKRDRAPELMRGEASLRGA